jgi:hypothetical protein
MTTTTIVLVVILIMITTVTTDEIAGVDFDVVFWTLSYLAVEVDAAAAAA